MGMKLEVPVKLLPGWFRLDELGADGIRDGREDHGDGVVFGGLDQALGGCGA